MSLLQKGRGNKLAPAEQQTFVCSFISKCNMARQAASRARMHSSGDRGWVLQGCKDPLFPPRCFYKRTQPKGGMFWKVSIMNLTPPKSVKPKQRPSCTEPQCAAHLGALVVSSRGLFMVS